MTLVSGPRSGRQDHGVTSDAAVPDGEDLSRELFRLADLVRPSAIRAVAQLGVADHLAAGPLAVGDLATACGAQVTPLHGVLRFLAGFGIFSEVRPGWCRGRRRLGSRRCRCWGPLSACRRRFLCRSPTGCRPIRALQRPAELERQAGGMILTNCRRAMGDRSRLLIIAHVLHTGPEPHVTKYLDVDLLLSCGGMLRIRRELGQVPSSAGLDVYDVIPLVEGYVLLEAAPSGSGCDDGTQFVRARRGAITPSADMASSCVEVPDGSSAANDERLGAVVDQATRHCCVVRR